MEISAPTENVKDWPLGEKIYSNWDSASKDLKEYTIAKKEFILDKGKVVFVRFSRLMGALVGFILS